MNDYLIQIMTQFRNVILNSTGVKRTFYQLIADKDISKAIALMQDRTKDVDEAIKEYNPQTHKVNSRPNKTRRKLDPYITEKLPRTRQRYINEVELFFLLGAPVKWKKDDGDDEAYKLFTDFIDKQYIAKKLRKLKRIAGAETESALIFRMYRDKEDKVACDSFVAARSTGYKLRPLFDQYGNLIAFAYGYITRETKGDQEHWDILTPENTFYCTRTKLGWTVDTFENLTGKINCLYARQLKAWDGAEKRIEREEHLDSKVADTNNYFADPIASATADVVQMMTTNNQAERIGQLIQMTGPNSRFEYVNPPQNSETRRDEMANLADSILFDTFTPDFSFEKMKGMGTLTGVAIKNAMVLGYIKRERNIEDWGEYVDRLRNVIIAILKQLHPDKAKALDELNVSFEFGEPFASDRKEMWLAFAQLYSSGVLSLEEAVNLLALTEAPEEEVKRIKKEAAERVALENPQTE